MIEKVKISGISHWLILVLLSLTWGSSFILIKKGLLAFDDLQVASLRIAISTLVSVPIVIYYRKKIQWEKWYIFLFVGLAGNGIPPFLFATAQTQVNSSLAGVLNTLTPIFTLLLALIFFRHHLSFRNITGVLVGLAGVFLISFSNGIDFGGDLRFILMIVIATVLYAVNINAVRYYFPKTNPMIILSTSFMLFGPFSFIYLWKSEIFSVIIDHPAGLVSLLDVAILALVGTMLATYYFFKLLQETTTVFASSVSYVIPLVAVGWGLLDGEPFNMMYIISLLLILAGVFLTRK